jgi:hypothetical protein
VNELLERRFTLQNDSPSRVNTFTLFEGLIFFPEAHIDFNLKSFIFPSSLFSHHILKVIRWFTLLIKTMKTRVFEIFWPIVLNISLFELSVNQLNGFFTKFKKEYMQNI